MKAETTSASRLQRDPLVRGLGWVSALLGVPQAVAPGGFARALGVEDACRHRWATAAVGVRELVVATGLLGRPHPAWLWARVGGDLMDLMMLTRAMKNHNGHGIDRTVAATAAVTALTVTDVYAAVTRPCRSTSMKLTATTTVNHSPDEVYAHWSDLERLPDFMAHLDRDAAISRPTANGAAGLTHRQHTPPQSRWCQFSSTFSGPVIDKCCPKSSITGAGSHLQSHWEKPAEPARLTPARVRRGFRNLRPHLHCPARAPKPSTPGPGRPRGSKNRRPTTHYDVGKTTRRPESIIERDSLRG